MLQAQRDFGVIMGWMKSRGVPRLRELRTHRGCCQPQTPACATPGCRAVPGNGGIQPWPLAVQPQNTCNAWSRPPILKKK